MLRPWFRTARADDWSGRLAGFWAIAILIPALLVALLVRLPDVWVAAAGGYRIVVRLVLFAAVWWLWGWMRAIVFAMLPATPYLIWRTLAVRELGRRIRVPVRTIMGIDVEARPPDEREVMVVELEDGRRLDVCPLHWKGAGKLYIRLMRISGHRRRRTQNPFLSGPGTSGIAPR
ncbi:MAG: hypothetical protein ACPG77_14610 [Nannocystaceae bacterium]